MNEEKIQTAHERIGGDEGLKKLVTLFYDNMESLAEAKPIRDLHAKDLKNAREKFYMFLSGWMGGPDRYIAAFGHPRLRARHLPFSIGTEERDQWLMCMKKALDDLDIDVMFKEQLMSSFTLTANHMMNKELD
ncbi:MAG: group II truncated hemoglobin [Proteobacteria bacterium]|nr:globin [Pseudomonadota bacterium]NOG60157.1 group II truncated hemoglobin [Pseudomonadota bacterium]